MLHLQDCLAVEKGAALVLRPLLREVMGADAEFKGGGDRGFHRSLWRHGAAGAALQPSVHLLKLKSPAAGLM
jgi:hypothetical protein